MIRARVAPRLVGARRELLGWNETEALGLLSGTSAASSAPNRALGDLAERIAEHPDARGAIAGAGDHLADRLAAVAPELSSEFTRWCDLHAYRCIHDDPGSPVWVERPWLVSRLLKDLVESGRRLCSEEILAQPGDVVHLDYQRVRTILLGGPATDLQDRVRQAKAERAWVNRHPGPPLYATAPSFAPRDLRGLPTAARRLNTALIWAQPRPPAPPGNEPVDHSSRPI